MEIVGSRLALISTQLNGSLFAMVALLRIAVSAQTQPAIDAYARLSQPNVWGHAGEIYA